LTLTPEPNQVRSGGSVLWLASPFAHLSRDADLEAAQLVGNLLPPCNLHTNPATSIPPRNLHTNPATPPTALHPPLCTRRSAPAALHPPLCTRRSAPAALHPPLCTRRSAPAALQLG
jgi:hypothetical protein